MYNRACAKYTFLRIYRKMYNLGLSSISGGAALGPFLRSDIFSDIRRKCRVSRGQIRHNFSITGKMSVIGAAGSVSRPQIQRKELADPTDCKLLPAKSDIFSHMRKKCRL